MRDKYDVWLPWSTGAYTQFSFEFKDSPQLTFKTNTLFYPPISEKLLGRLYLLVWLQRRLILTMMCCVLLSTYVLPAKPNPIVCPNVRACILQFQF